MAVSLERFSIRDYASKMRAADLAECWPFHGDSGEAKREAAARAFLPPITVAKFRWWADELETSTKVPESMSDSMSRPEQGNDSVAAPGASRKDAEPPRPRRNPAAMTRAKGRMPKKRSIVEIFAVSPQIKTVNFDDEEEEEENGTAMEDANHFGPSKFADSMADFVSKKKKKDKVIGIVKKIKKEKLKKFVKKKKKTKIDPSSQAKTAYDVSTKMIEPRCNMRAAKDILDAVLIRKKKPSKKQTSASKKHKAQTSRLISKQQKKVSPVRSILKNHREAISRQKSSTFCKIQGCEQETIYGSQQLGRHVQFSGKDDVIGPRNKYFASTGCPTSICHKFSEAIASSDVSDNQEEASTFSAIEASESDEDMSVSINEETEHRPIIQKKYAASSNVTVPQFQQPHISFQEEVNHCSDNMVIPNQAVPHDDNSIVMLNQDVPCGDDSHVSIRSYTTARHIPAYATRNLNTSHNLSHAGIVFSIPRDGHDPNLSAQISGYTKGAFNNSGNLVNYLGDPTSKAFPVGPMANMTAFQQASPGFATNQNANERLPFLPHFTAESCSIHPLQQQHHPYTEDLIGSLQSLPKLKKRQVVDGKRCTEEGYFGLPLNSRGELIQLHSSCKDGFNQLKKPTIPAVSSSSLPLFNHGLPHSLREWSSPVEKRLPSKPQKLLRMQNYVKDNPHFNVPSTTVYGEVQDTGESAQHWLNSVYGNGRSCALGSELANMSCHGFRQYGQVNSKRECRVSQTQEHSEHAKQPTMRLMGKDVTVGKSSKDSEVHEDGKVWTDKEIIAEHIPASTMTDGFSNRRYDWISHPELESSNGAVVCSLDIQNNQTTKSTSQTKVTESGPSLPCLDWNTNRVSPKVCSTISGMSNSRAHPFACPPLSPAILNRPLYIQKPTISSFESSKFGSGLPFSTTTIPTSCQQMLPNSVDFMCDQGFPCTTKSDAEFPPHPKFRDYVQPLSFRRSSKGLFPWLFHEPTDTLTPSQSSSHLTGKPNSYNMLGNRYMTFPLACHSSAASHPYNSMTSHSHSKILHGPSSSAHPPLIPVPPGLKPVAPVSISYKNKIKVKDRRKPKSSSVNDPNSRKKTERKPPAPENNEKPAKLPNLENPENSEGMTLLNARQQLANDTYDSNRDGATSPRCRQGETQKKGFQSSSEIDSNKVYVPSRPGPIKLTAGAKHILKPNETADLDKSKPTHSTIHFSSVTESFTAPESLRKSTKIYWF